MKFIFSTAICSLFCLQIAQAKVLNADQKLADFNQLNIFIDSSYGPLEYKQKERGLKLDELRDKYRSEILAAKTNAEFYYSIARYISEFHDGHFGSILPTDYKAEIAITTDLVEGKVLIDAIDRKKISEQEFPFVRGDEVISFNGKPVQNEVDEVSRYLGGGFILSEKRSAAQSLFIRSGKRFPVPTGDVEVEVRRGTSNIIEKVRLKWEVTGTPFDEKMSVQGFNKHVFNQTSYNTLSIIPDLTEIMGNERLEKSFRCSGSTRIDIPDDATIIMRTPFVAYYHSTPKGQIGYLRIPHYYFDKPEEVFRQYEYAVQVLEKNTLGLIIDQDHNCGGSVDFLHAILGLFISEPVKPMQFELLASKAEYFEFKSWLSQAPSDTIDYKNSEKVLEVIQESWEKGDFLTPKIAIGGEDWIYPNNRIHYTKPIVMLIDELSGSGGDAFPALMGGYKRATLLGTRTWGLGGHVAEIASLRHSALDLRMTKSLFYRPDGVAVENNGAVPDVPYTITRDDFMYGYKNYQKAYLQVLLEKLK